MKPMKIEHIGIAVKSLKDSIPLIEKLLGTACYRIEEVPDQKVTTAFFKIGEVKIELLETTAADGPVGRFVEKRGEGVHHIALAVDDVAASLRELQGQGVQLVDSQPRAGADGLTIAFLQPGSTNGVLTELCQRPKP